MVKHVFTIIIFILLNSIQAQNSIDEYLDRVTEVTFTSKVDRFDSSAASKIIKDILQIKDQDVRFELVYSKESSITKHLLYQQFYKDLPILNSTIKLNTNLLDGILSYNDRTHKKFDLDFQKDKSLIFLETDTVIVNETVLIPNTPEIIFQRQIILNQDRNYEIIKDMDGIIKYSRNLNVSKIDTLNPTDSLINVSVFYPDPLTSANVAYGSPYVDSNDIDFALLNNEIVTKTVVAKYDTSSNVYKLENQFVKITDHSTPFIPAASSSSPNFSFTRSESGFEDVNAFYHITNLQCYLQSIGINLVNYAIHLDTHGNSGNDNSFFTASSNPPRITFGEGGVDDAEDADVIIHEFGHAITHSAAPNSNSGVQRQAIDEGFGDYLAASYSLDLNPNNWENVFSWDGHNEFWNGRSAITTKHYPEDLQNNLYQDANIWSSTLMEISQAIGREEFDKILFNSLYNYSTGITMIDASKFLVKTDSLLNNGLYYPDLCFYLGQRGFIPECSLSVRGPDLENETILIRNSAKFARGESLNLLFKQEGEFDMNIYNVKGQPVYTRHLNVFANSAIEISSSDLPKGIYILSISNGDNVVGYKLVRYQ